MTAEERTRSRAGRGQKRPSRDPRARLRVVHPPDARVLIPLTAAETRRLFNLYTRVIHPEEFHEHWSAWRRRRQASARKSHYARRTRNHETLL